MTEDTLIIFIGVFFSFDQTLSKFLNVMAVIKNITIMLKMMVKAMTGGLQDFITCMMAEFHIIGGGGDGKSFTKLMLVEGFGGLDT